MGRHDQRCSICAAPSAVREAVNLELSKPIGERMKLRDLEKISHFSKSVLSKHSRRCLVRQVLARHRSQFYDPARGRVFVHVPDGAPGWPPDDPRSQPQPLETFCKQHGVSEGDVIVSVVYEPAPIKTPKPTPDKIEPNE